MICLICARSGSKGIKNKNIAKIKNKNLLQITIELAKKVKEIDKIILSTDSLKIAKLGRKYGANVPFIRPKHLSKDNSSEWSVWKHAVKFCQKNYNFQNVIILPVVSPLRKLIDIDKSIKLFKKNKKKAVITVSESSRNPYFNMVTLDKNKNAKLVISKKKTVFRRQDAPKVYDISTISYILSKDLINKRKSLFDCQLVAEIIPKSRSLDIDDKFDLEIARILYGRKI